MAGKALRATAYHEAGHAVARFALGRRIDHATIRPEGDTLGHVRGRVLPILKQGEELADRPRQVLDDYVVCAYAGPLAERRFAGRANHIGAAGDYEAIGELLVSLHPDQRVRDAYSRYLEELARSLLDVHWYLVDAVAAALLQRETLGGSRVHKVIHEAILEADPSAAPSPVFGPYSPEGWRATARVVGLDKLFPRP